MNSIKKARLRMKLSLRQAAELMRPTGYVPSASVVMYWENGIYPVDPRYVAALYAASVGALQGKPIDRLPQYVLGWQIRNRVEL